MYAVSHQLSNADRKRGWTISIIIHLLLLLLAFLPFILTTIPRPDYSQAIVIQFDKPPQVEESSTMQSGSAAAASSAESEASEQMQAPREQVAVSSVSSIQPAAAMPVPTRSINMTQATPEVVLPQSKTKSSTSDNFFSKPLEVNDRVEVDRVEAFKAKPNPALQQKVTWHVSDNESSEKGAPSNFDFQSKGTANNGTKTGGSGSGGKAPDGQAEDAGFDPFGDGTFDGKGKGTGNAGKDTGVGQDGKGLNFGDFAGDGLLNREIVYHARAELYRIATQPGKMVINLCVDQLGKVIYTQYDMVHSTIKDKAIAAKAEQVAKLYKFAEDHSIIKEQCGRLNFVFEIKK